MVDEGGFGASQNKVFCQSEHRGAAFPRGPTCLSLVEKAGKLLLLSEMLCCERAARQAANIMLPWGLGPRLTYPTAPCPSFTVNHPPDSPDQPQNPLPFVGAPLTPCSTQVKPDACAKHFPDAHERISFSPLRLPIATAP